MGASIKPTRAEREDPRRIIASAAGADLPAGDLDLARTIGVVFRRDVMQIVQPRRSNPGVRIWEVDRNRLRFHADSASRVATMVAEIAMPE